MVTGPAWLVDGRPAGSADRSIRAGPCPCPCPCAPPGATATSSRCCGAFAGSGRNVVPLLSPGQQLRDDVVVESGGLPQRRDNVAAAPGGGTGGDGGDAARGGAGSRTASLC